MDSFNKRGFLCAPGETLDHFRKRCDLLEGIGKCPLETVRQHFKTAEPVVMRLGYEDLGVDVDWLCGFFSKKTLPFWEGAATWVIQKEGIDVPLVQFKKKSEELLRHELVHIVRSSFQEPIYEEVLAYATSSKWWRRLFGPLFASSKESFLYMICVFISFLGVWFPLYVFYFMLPMGIFLGFLGIRLSLRQRVFKKALKKIQDIFDVPFPLQVALRLSDKDITMFAHLDRNSLLDYIHHQSCLRWVQIRASYRFKKK